MQRKVLVATVAAAPILALAFGASAETSISTARTTPIATSTATGTAADDIRVTSDGSIKPTAAGAMITLDSNNKVTNLGTLATVGVNDSTGVLLLGGRTGSLTNSSSISLTEDYTATDTDSDGDIDGAFAIGSNRYGIRLTGAGAFTGDILNDSAGTISIEGNTSAGISLESQLIGNLTSAGSISVVGDNSFGVRIAAPVTGKVILGGSISTQGANSVGAAIDGNVTGALTLQGSITSTGYRYTTRSSQSVLDKLDADDLLQGGSGVRISGNVTGGLLLQGSNNSTAVGSDGNTITTTIASSTSGTSSITTYGSAPALLIGSSTQNVTLGAVGTADNAYGVIAKGSISASGVYDKVSATGVKIGTGAGGFTTTLAGGLRNDGQISATAIEADARGLQLSAGANVAEILNRNSIIATSSSFAGSGVTASARAIVLDAGSSATTLNNRGTIAAGRTGETGDAIAIVDQSGTLKTVNNTGSIRAVVSAPTTKADGTSATTTATGTAIALDLRANTTGVTVNQSAPTSYASTSTFPSTDTVTTTVGTAVTTTSPSIIGDVLFGSGNDTLRVTSGSVIGNIAFGAGADTFVVDGGAVVLGNLTDSDGKLDITVGTGSLGIANAATINVTSLNVGSSGKILFTADAAAGTNTKLVVSGSANIASGADLGLRLTSLVKQPTSYTVVTAGTLNVGSLGQGLLADSPYLYVASARTDANNVYVDVRRRTAAEIGMSRSEASAYDAVFAALGKDSGIATTFLAQNGKDGFLNLYDQMLPSQGEGLFASLQAANQMISSATAVRPDKGGRYGPDSVWIQEINSLVRRDDGATQGSDNQAFGFVAGYEAMGDAGGALGLTLAYINAEEHDTRAQVGEQTTASFIQGGAYWRRTIGGWTLNTGGGLGYGWFDGERRFIAPDSNGDGVADLVRKYDSTWNAGTANLFAGTSYEAKFGRYYARPEGRLDYVWLSEGAHSEKGTTGSEQAIAKRTSSNLSGDFGIAFGADYGKDVWWRPEVRVGYRQTLAGKVGDTVARFTGGDRFVMSAMNDKQGAATLGFSLKAGTPMSYLALEGGVEAAKKQKRYNLRLAGRAMF